MPTFDYKLDDDPYSTTEHVLTPVQILSNAGLDPNTHYLKEIQGKHQISYENEPTKEIHMHQHMEFISISKGPTPVS